MTYRRLAVLLTFCLCACASRPPAVTANAAGNRISNDPERYIVAGIDNEPAPGGHAGSSPKGYDGLTAYGPSSRAAKLLRDVERDYGLREVTAWPIAPLHMHCAVLELPANADRASVVAALTQDRRVRIAQPLQTFTTQTSVGYDDPYVGLQRGFQQMEVSEAHTWSRGEGVRIAIIDTGADTLHPDLRGAIVQVGNFVDSDTEQFRRDRHGTELAGIIAAVANNHEGIVGIAPGAKLFVLKACWQEHDDADAARCNSFTLAQALTAALDAHAQIVNLSLAGPADPLLHELLREGLRRGMLFIGAAPSGAEGRDYFLAVDGVIEVAVGGSQGDSGKPLHAPGKEILTLLPGGRYDFATGTSLATAHVTGTVALLLRKNANLTAAEVYRLLHDTTTHLESGDSINACAAIASLMGHGLCSHEDEKRVAMH